MKITLHILVAAFSLFALSFSFVSCAARPDGTKTFGGLDATQWGGVAVKAGSSYLDQKRATDREHVTNAKGVVEVQPAPAEPSWLGWGLSILGL